jgi:hypothetical protein
MKKALLLSLCLSLGLNSNVLAGLGSKKAAYQGGTTKNQDFPGAKDAVDGILHTDDSRELLFKYRLNKEERIYRIPYQQIIDIEYGQKAGRRVGAAIATAILISPVGLFLLFSKKRKHFVTIGYKGADGKEEVAVFELGKDIVRTTLAIIETRSGKRIEYQDDEGRKFNQGGAQPENRQIEAAPESATSPPPATARPEPKSTPAPKRCYDNGRRVPCPLD